MELHEEKITLLRIDESGQSVLLGGDFIPGGGQQCHFFGHQCGLFGDLNSERTISRYQLLLIFQFSDLPLQFFDLPLQFFDLPLQFSDVSYDFFLRRHCFTIFTDLPKFCVQERQIWFPKCIESVQKTILSPVIPKAK